MSTASLGVNDSLRNSFASEMSEFIEQVKVLKKDGPVRSDCQRVLVVIERSSSRCGDGFA